ncbi:MAG: hypothetical protein J0L82_15750 [Deltaproteobacteria bacterium]|jgi:uncharacterized membrane protein|nr:hypothetical protein [Deltaproteobacteria bacterium]
MVGNRRLLKLSASIAISVLAGLLFIFLVWSAQTDAQGAIGLLLFFPILLGLLVYSVWLSRETPIGRNLVLLFAVLPIALFYLSSLAGRSHKASAAYSGLVMNLVAQGFQTITGLTPYDCWKHAACL